MSSYIVEQYVPVVGWVPVEERATEEAALIFATRRQAVIHMAETPEAQLRVRHRGEVSITLRPKEQPRA